LKILEAMSMGCAIVSTRIGAEGIPAEHERHLLLADTAEEFAAQVIRVLTEPDLRSRLGQEAAEWVRQRYDWAQLCNPVPGLVNSILTGK
jgi:glycosyltransferase involved in cell wall biosynthesis